MQHGSSPRTMNTGSLLHAGSQMQYSTTSSNQMMYGGSGSPMSPGSYEKESRKVSSVIVSEEFLEQARPEEVRYIEVEQFEERVTRIPKKETRHVEKRVPKIEMQYVDKVVEVPQVVYVDVPVEVPQYVDVVVQKPVTQWVDRPVEHIVHKPVPHIVKREERVNVPGPIIEIPKPYVVEQKVEVPRYVAEEVPMIVAQTVKPILTETAEAVDVPVFEYEPEVVAVDIHVAKAVDAKLIAAGVVSQHHRVVTVPAGQYNMMMRQLNVHLSEQEMALLPFMQESGQIPFLREEIRYEIARQGLDIEGWQSRGPIYEQVGTTHAAGGHYSSSAQFSGPVHMTSSHVSGPVRVASTHHSSGVSQMGSSYVGGQQYGSHITGPTTTYSQTTQQISGPSYSQTTQISGPVHMGSMKPINHSSNLRTSQAAW